MPEPAGGGIFVSYRRQESSHVAGRLYDRLVDQFGSGRVFIDVDTIEPGADFTEAIAQAVDTCQVLLAIIGPDWVTAADDQGRRRLDDPDDIVRVEIEAALSRDIRLIPILVEDARMPVRQDLPPSLVSLARRNAFIVRHETFRHDADRLVTSIAGVIGAREATQPRDSGGGPDLWQLELVSAAGSAKVFRLLSAAGAHIITVVLSPIFRWDRIEVDGECVVRKYDLHATTFPLTALGSKIGANATIRVSRPPSAVGDFSIVLTIGDRILRYPQPL